MFSNILALLDRRLKFQPCIREASDTSLAEDRVLFLLQFGFDITTFNKRSLSRLATCDRSNVKDFKFVNVKQAKMTIAKMTIAKLPSVS